MHTFTKYVLLIFILYASCWPIKNRKIKFNSTSTCCILAKSNINVTRANQGREFFAELILNNESYKNVNENNICSLMHFLMQEAVLNEQSITFSKGDKIHNQFSMK